MPTDTELKQLVINELTEEQYNGLTPNEDELYLTPDPMTTNTDGSVTLNQGLTVSTNGNVEVGKNLEVDGTTKMNGGFEPIHSYTLKQDDNNYLELEVYYEKGPVTINELTGYLFNGIMTHYEDSEQAETGPCQGIYILQGSSVVMATCYTLSYVLAYLAGKISVQSFIQTDTLPNLMADNLKTLFGNQSLVGEGNIDLYRHKLMVQDKDGTTPFVVYYTSSSNLKCDSVQDLRTLLKVGDIPVTLYGNLQSDFSPAALVVSSSACTIKTSATASVSVTMVSDTVTTI